MYAAALVRIEVLKHVKSIFLDKVFKVTWSFERSKPSVVQLWFKDWVWSLQVWSKMIQYWFVVLIGVSFLEFFKVLPPEGGYSEQSSSLWSPCQCPGGIGKKQDSASACESYPCKNTAQNKKIRPWIRWWSRQYDPSSSPGVSHEMTFTVHNQNKTWKVHQLTATKPPTRQLSNEATATGWL